MGLEALGNVSPGHKGRHEGGKDVETMGRHIDVLPTLAELTGAELPENNEAEGRSLYGVIDEKPDGEIEKEWPHRYLFFHYGRWFDLKDYKANPKMTPPNPDDYKDKTYAVRDEKWRLVENQLFDLGKDPGEKTDVAADHPDVAADHPEVVAKMKAAYDVWWQECRPLMVNENADLNTGNPFVEEFKKQKAERGIPNWENPHIE